MDMTLGEIRGRLAIHDAWMDALAAVRIAQAALNVAQKVYYDSRKGK